jgi:hypothetical protein
MLLLLFRLDGFADLVDGGDWLPIFLRWVVQRARECEVVRELLARALMNRLATLCAAVFACAGRAAPAEWPRWNGNGRTAPFSIRSGPWTRSGTKMPTKHTG